MNFTILIIALMLFHWVADFVLQSRWMAENKSSRWDALSMHVGIYTCTMFVMTAMFIIAFNAYLMAASFTGIVLFALINGVAHFVVDAITSRMTSYFYKRGKIHDFFVVIGADQWLHFAIIAITAQLLLVA